jgi:hypothetical protein
MSPSTVPPFTCDGVTFRCYAVAARYEWHDDRSQRVAARNEGSSTCWARAGNQIVGRSFLNLKQAMQAAVRAPVRIAA